MNKKKLPQKVQSTAHEKTQSLLRQAFQLHQKGDLIAAKEMYGQILHLQPSHFDALHLSGLIAAQNEKFDDAVALILRAIAVNPKNFHAYCNLGNVYLNLSQYEIAIKNYTTALSLNPLFEEALYSRGLANQRFRKLEEAKGDYESALRINPNHVGTLTNLGNVFQLQKKYDQAIEAYGKAINLKLPFAEPFNNRGNLYHEQRKFDEAIADFDKALEINPNYPEALSNRANSLFYLKDYERALEGYGKAIALRPNYAEALHNRGNLYRELRRYELAMADYDLALAIKPDYEYLKGVHFANKMNICDWSNLDAEWKQVCSDIRLSKKTIAPFMVLPISDSLELQKKVAELWVEEKHPAQPAPEFHTHKTEDARICIGYFSADFHEHATMYLMAQLFELHDKNKFRIIGFSFGPDKQDSMRQRAVNAFEEFYDVRNKTEYEIAQFSRDLGVDIAVDLKGFTLDARTGIFAHRAAPIQVNYLGYPGTMGADFVDYIIADKVIIPEHLQYGYSEKVLYMPDCYQVNDQKREIANIEYSRRSLGLPETGFIYCSFNANYKITPQVFECWMSILSKVDGSILWLLEDNSRAAINLKNEAKKRGVDPERIVFAQHVPISEHLARLRVANLFLDAWPCNAHTTASDALWAGLPVLTFPGEAFASRVAASLVTAVGLPEMVVNSQSEYENTAIHYGKNPDNLFFLQEKLKSNKATSPLFDSLKFAKNIESLYIQLIQA